MVFPREEKSEVLAECREELEHANSLVTKLKAEVNIVYQINLIKTWLLHCILSNRTLIY